MLIRKRFLYLIVSAGCFLSPGVVHGQDDQLAIEAGETFYVHPEGEIWIFSDMSNSGSFISAEQAKIIFTGKRWNNAAGSLMPDESTNGIEGVGGTFTFTSVLAGPQYIANSNNSRLTTGFPNITIANSESVILEGSDLTIRNNLSFQNGHLLLSGSGIIMGANSTITGYNKNRYIVTGVNPDGGFLSRSVTGTNHAAVFFPVGTTVNSYTPVSIGYTGVAQNLKVQVFEDVFERAISGTPDNMNSVKKTWQVSVDRPDPKAVLNITTQHNISDEGSQFAFSRPEAFISRFQGNTGTWDVIPGAGSVAGALSLGDPVSGAFITSRTSITGFSLDEYFSVSVINERPILGLRIPEGISPNNDGLNDRFIIQNLNPADNVRMQVYNRWQSLVYKDLNYKNTFDGTGNQHGLFTNVLPDGTYYYVININSGKAIRGFIIINR